MKSQEFRDGFAGPDDIQLAQDFAERPMPWARAFALSRALVFVAIAITAATLTYDVIAPTPAVSSVTPTAIQPAWFEVTRASGAFAVSAVGLDSANSNYLVRRHREGGGRKDIMTWGAPDSSGGYVRIELYRPGSESPATFDAFEAMAALASDAKINAELSETPNELSTKFGEMPIIEMTVLNGDMARSCVAIAGAWEEPRFRVAAWWCNAGIEMVPHGQIACLIDKLTLMSSGGDGRLAEFFAKAELKRNFCGAPGVLVAPTHKRPDDWMAIKAEPKLRGRIAGR